LIDWFEETSSEDRRELVKQLSTDRDLLLEKLALLYPRSEKALPSENVEAVLTDVCGFHVVDEPLARGQLALCDFSSRTVIVNSELEANFKDDSGFELLRRSTLAHELGHIRLHTEEIEEGCTLHYYGSSGRFIDSRSFQKEREADFYAGIFLVPVEALLQEKSVQTLLKNKQERVFMKSSVLWKMVYRLAHLFQVSPSFMKQCFLALGWLEQGSRSSSGLKQLQVRF